jgi:phosphoglycolate phosphatase
MKYRLAIFDFDGTLADSFPFFTTVFNQIAEKHRFKTLDAERVPELRHYTARQLMDYVGLPAWKLPLVSRSFIAMMKQNAVNISLFDGVDQMLQQLASNGVKLVIVSSNSRENITQILGPANSKLFSQFECGMSIFGKTSRIRKVLQRAGITNDEAIYIGDQTTDAEAARKGNIAFGAVTWGYGAIEALKLQSPRVVFESVAAIGSIA